MHVVAMVDAVRLICAYAFVTGWPTIVLNVRDLIIFLASII
jgi:hypothetical protein